MHFNLPIPVKNLLKATSFWQDNRLFLREFKHFRRIAVLAIVFALMAAILEGGTVGLIASFLQGLTNPNEPPIQTTIGWFDRWVLAVDAPASNRIYRLAALITVATCLRSSFTYLAQLYSIMSQLNLSERLRQQVFEQLQRLSLRYYSTVRTGELMNHLEREAIQIKQAVGVIAIFISRGATLLAYGVSMLLLSWQLSIASIMIFCLLSVGLSTVTARVREASFEVPKANKHFNSISLEFINGIRTVHASATQTFERQKFYSAIKQVTKAETRVTKLSALVQPLTQGVSSLILVAMVVLAFEFLVVDGNLRAASLLTFLFTLSRTMPLLTQINGAIAKLNSFQGSLDSLKEFLSWDHKPYLKDGSNQFSGLKESIDFVSVNFGYNTNELILHDITLSIKQGETTALVGASGAGKSTLADLIARFHDPTQGEILLDGVDLREFKINSVRQRMAIVSQDTFIFNASVKYNIAYGLEDIDEEAVQEVARQANALGFILDLPEGFDTVLGDRGVRLSGGQRQRIAIARALLRNPEVLILDEATSALDSVTERLIQESLERLSKGRTVIAIAHRLSTIVRADRVVVLEKGRIVEQGKYQELLEQRGELWKYHQMQHEVGQAG